MGEINPAIKEAIRGGDLEALRNMVSDGQDINLHDPRYPVFVEAAAHGTRKILEYLLHIGADINAVNNVGSSALYKAATNRNDENVNTLIELGIDMNRHGGEALRIAAWKGHLDVVQLLADHGADINFRGKDMVFPYCPTPLNLAAKLNHIEIVKFLLERGADVTISDKYGDRPYTIAKKNKHKELMELIRQYEPDDLISLEKKVEELKKAKLPAEVIKFLKTDKRRIELPESRSSDYVEFYSAQDVLLFEWEGTRLVDLVSDIEGYSATGFLVWIPERKTFGSLDAEHAKLMVITDMTWKDFSKTPAYYVDRILDGVYEDD